MLAEVAQCFTSAGTERASGVATYLEELGLSTPHISVKVQSASTQRESDRVADIHAT
jgi:hypothetical protein